MTLLHKFLSLPPSDRHLLVRAFLAVAAFRTMLWLLHYKKLKRLIVYCLKVIPSEPAQVDPFLPDKIVRFVETAGRYIPRATCLTQALAAQALLRRAGFPAELSIGVAKDAKGHFQAHAWLEQNGKVIIGDRRLHQYTPLPLESLGKLFTEA